MPISEHLKWLCFRRKYLETNFSHEFRNNKTYYYDSKVFGILLTNKVQCSDVTPPIDVIHSVAAGRDFPLADK